MKALLGKLSLLGAFLVAGTQADAAIVYYLENVTFADGGTATGSFTTDDTITTLLSANITTSPNAPFAGFTFTNTTFVNASALQITQSSNQLQFSFAGNPLTASGNFTIFAGVGPSYEFNGFARYVATGLVTTTDPGVPEPGTVTLVLTGFACLIAGARKSRIG